MSSSVVRKYFYIVISVYIVSLFLRTWYEHIMERQHVVNPEQSHIVIQSKDNSGSGFVQEGKVLSSRKIEIPERMVQWFKLDKRITELAKREALPTLEEVYYRKRDRKVNLFNYGYIINEQDLCSDQTEMLIVVNSYHPHSDRRSAIRKTWGSFAHDQPWPNSTVVVNIRLVFVFGRHLSERFNHNVLQESKEHHDVIQGDFMDDYRNMTLKSLFGLRYFADFCQARYLLKSDDDMFVNLPYLITILRQKQMKRAIMGPLLLHSRVNRDGKWKVSEGQFPFTFYPPYEAGAAYVISGDVVRELFETSEYMPAISIDDVYVTGILGKIINVTHVHQPGFAFWTSPPSTACDFLLNLKVSSTKMTPIHLQHVWSDMQRGKDCQVHAIR